MRPTTETNAAIEWEVLTSELGRELMAEVGASMAFGPSDMARWRKRADIEWITAAHRLVGARVRGETKFARADRMWFDITGLEQATDEVVAKHKAARFADTDVVDLCCGIGGDAIAMAGVAKRVLTVDRDQGMLRRCLWNAAVHGVNDRILAIRSNAETVPIPANALVHVDPDRRANTRRAREIDGYAPGPEFLRSLPDRSRGGAIKLGPASDFDSLFPRDRVEIEITSLKGECKEATVWFGSLKTCGRRATMLPSDETWTDRESGSGVPASRALGSWLLDPDPSLTRSGLFEGFAATHGYARPFEDIHVLTGDAPTSSSWLTSFEIIESLPLDWKVIRRQVLRHGLRVRDVRTRGLPVTNQWGPADRLRGASGTPANLYLIRGSEGSRAILCRPQIDPEADES